MGWGPEADGTWPWGSEKRESRKLSAPCCCRPLSFVPEHTKAIDQDEVQKAERGTKDRVQRDM